MTNREGTIGSTVRRDFRPNPADSRTAPRPGRLALAGLTALSRRELAALGALIGLVVTGATIVVASASTSASFGIPRQGHHNPTWVVGPLAPVGMAMTSHRFILLFAAMWCFYLVVMALADAVRPRWAIAAILLLTVVITIGPPLYSRDVFNYIDYARLSVVHHLNPYVYGPVSAYHDPVFPFVRWIHTPSVYGPLFTFMSFPLALLGVAGALWAFKAMAGAAALGCVGLIWHAAKRVGESPVFAVLLLGLNPVFLVLAVSGAHNDVVALFAMVAAITFAVGRRESLAGASAVAAVAIKATAGLALPFMVAGIRRRLPVLLGMAGAALVIGLAALALFGTSITEPFDLAARHRNYYFEQSVPQHVAMLVGVDPRAGAVRRIAAIIGIAAIVLLLLRSAWRREWLSGAGWAMFALLVTTTYMLPWYTIWVLPFAAVARDRRLVYATLGLGTFVVASRLYFLGL